MAYMRTVLLPGFDKPCSALGFGCANLMGRVSRRQSERALAYAFDCGVTFFDTSRSYGWGRSEEVLGGFAKGKRDKILICTKFGTLPPPRNRLREWAKPVVRNVLSAASRFGFVGLRSRVMHRVVEHRNAVVQSGRFEVAAANASLEASLRELGTDYLDLWLMHNPTFDDVADGATYDFMQRQVARGTIRAYGVSTTPGVAKAILDRYPETPAVQIPNNLFEAGLIELPKSETRIDITNVPFGSGAALARLGSLLGEQPQFDQQWSQQLGWESMSPFGTARLLLAAALQENRGGVVVCGMHDPERIRMNTDATSGPLPAELPGLIDSIRGVLAPSACDSHASVDFSFRKPRCY